MIVKRHIKYTKDNIFQDFEYIFNFFHGILLYKILLKPSKTNHLTIQKQGWFRYRWCGVLLRFHSVSIPCCSKFSHVSLSMRLHDAPQSINAFVIFIPLKKISATALSFTFGIFFIIFYLLLVLWLLPWKLFNLGNCRSPPLGIVWHTAAKCPVFLHLLET